MQGLPVYELEQAPGPGHNGRLEPPVSSPPPAVGGIAEDRMPYVRQVDPYLMSPPGLEIDRQPGGEFEFLHHPVGGGGLTLPEDLTTAIFFLSERLRPTRVSMLPSARAGRPHTIAS